MNSEKQKTILLVEDEPITARATQKILEKYKYRVILAYNGEEAIETVPANAEIDIILMDIDLGSSMDGTEAAEIILAKHDIPLIFISSHTEREVVEKTEGITSYGYIVKNSGETVLIASIKMAFRLYNARFALLESEKRLKRAERIGKIGNWEYNFLNNTIIWSDEVYTLYERDPALGPPSYDEEDKFYTTEVAERLKGYAQQVYETGEPIRDYEFEIRLKSGKKSHFNGTMFPTRDSTGHVIKLYGTFQDITGYKKIQQKLEKNNMMFDSILENSTSHIFVRDTQGKYLLMNTSCASLLGTSPDEAIGKTDYDLFPQKTADLFQAEDREIFLSGKPIVTERTIEIKNKKRDFSVNKFPLINNRNGKIYAVCGIINDITNRGNNK